MAKFKNAVILSKSIFMASNFFMQMSNVSTKYQDVSVKAVTQVEFPVHALPMQH